MFAGITSWVHANVRISHAVNALVGHIEKAESQQHDWHAVLGGGLIRRKRAKMIYSQGGETFMYTLTDQQAADMSATEAMMAFTPDGMRRAHTEQSLIQIKSFELTNVDNLRVGQTVHGVCTFEGTIDYADLPCLEVHMVLQKKKPSSSTSGLTFYVYLHLLSAEAPLEFDFGPIVKTGEEKQWELPQVAAVFLRFCIPPDSRLPLPAVPVSNVLGVLATLR